ncbi:unnamed protein product [Nippostrongylus brasiliensis]|uniref:Serpentine receptor class gamma n=1 Tax=Nippostrongylus brasiliensis TaxID=27835 RepID=A0A0N4Y618_NIPBR|nr:unnamed protein product [Nippostrongylus brasiliensis]
MENVLATSNIRILGAFLILIPTVIGLLLHVLLASSLFTASHNEMVKLHQYCSMRNAGWKKFRENGFYVITVQLQLCDVCALLLDVYIAFPLTLTGVQYMGDNVPLYYGPLFFQGIAFNGIFALSFFLSANRFLLFIYPALHNRLFTTLGTRIMSLVVWIHAFVVVGLSNVFGCVKQFSKDDFYFWYNCSNRVPGKLHYMDLMNYESYAIVCGMIVIGKVAMEALQPIRVVSSVMLLIAILVGLALQVVLAFVMRKGWKEFSENSFYIVTLQMMICNAFGLLVNLYITFPLILTGVQYMGNSIPLYDVPLFFDGVSFNGLLMFSFFLTTNRFLLFVFPRLNSQLFSSLGTKIFLFFVQLYRRKFEYPVQLPRRELNSLPITKKFMQMHSYVVICAITVMYAAIYIKIRWSSLTRKVVRREFMYLIQAVLMCGLMAVEIFLFTFLPMLHLRGYNQLYLSLLLDLIGILNYLVTPLILFLFNGEIRRQLASLLSSYRLFAGWVSSPVTKIKSSAMFHTS